MFDDMIREHVAPFLKRHGFKKQRLNWNRSKDAVVQVVNIQNWSLNRGDYRSFTLNLGVCYPNVWTICWGKALPKSVKEYDCLPRTRVGPLLAEDPQRARDKWWDSRPDVDHDELGKELVTILKEKGLPYLEDMSEPRNVLDSPYFHPKRLSGIEMICLALFKHELGNALAASELLARIAGWSEDWSKRVDEVRARLDNADLP